jgi:cell division protease FtsH
MAITIAGMSSKIGLVAVNQVMALNSRSALENASEKTAEAVDAEVKSWMDAACVDATKLLSKNKATVQKLAEELLRRETLTGEEIEEIVFGKKAKAKVKVVVAKAEPKSKTKKMKKRG